MNIIDRLNNFLGWPERDEYAKTANRRIASICFTILIVGIYIEVIFAYFFLSHDDFSKITIALFLPFVPVSIVAIILGIKYGMYKYHREMVNKNAAKRKRAVIGLIISSLGVGGWMVYIQHSWEHSSLFETILSGFIEGSMWGGAMYWIMMRKRRSEDEPISDKNTQ